MDYVAYVFYAIGAFFNFAGVVGILRMPDPFCKLQTSTKNVFSKRDSFGFAF